MNPPNFQRAVSADLPEIRRLWSEAGQWLAEKGLDQWQYPLREESVLRSIRRGDCWLVVEADGYVAGTITVDEFADPEFWSSDDDLESALYVHRMIVDPSRSGRQIGSAMLAFAERLAKTRHRKVVRLDAWRTNSQLHSYYLTQGFRLVRIVDLPHRRSGALFERAVH